MLLAGEPLGEQVVQHGKIFLSHHLLTKTYSFNSFNKDQKHSDPMLRTEVVAESTMFAIFTPVNLNKENIIDTSF